MHTVPAPWNLRGHGFMLLYRFPPQFGNFHPQLSDDLPFLGGWGALMLVDYFESPVGPYHELLLIPGKYLFPRGGRYSISHIFVDSLLSTQSGRENWAIPKQMAHFSWEHYRREDYLSVQVQGRVCFEARLHSGGPRFPLNTRLLPLQIGQQDGPDWLFTQPQGHGKARLARLIDLRTDEPDLLPDLTPFRPWLALKIENFRLCFPEPEIEPAGEALLQP
jgi:hypothetical protein